MIFIVNIIVHLKASLEDLLEYFSGISKSRKYSIFGRSQENIEIIRESVGEEPKMSTSTLPPKINYERFSSKSQ